jgi:hypothetical protein
MTMQTNTTIAAVLIMIASIFMALPIVAFGGLPPVDLNYDGDVDGDDLAAFARTDTANDMARFAASFGLMENFSHVYAVGPGQAYADPGEVPWESLEAGSLVQIHYRKAPYRNKWVLAVAGTADAPIVVRGIPEDGLLPVISGEDATTRQALDYWNEVRSVIKVGGSSRPSAFPSYVIIENLEVCSARPAYSFTDDRGNSATYSENAAAIHVEMGSHITIRNCILRDCGNGFFAGSDSADLLLENNYIADNGIAGSWYQHNNYTECQGITFQYNHFGPLRDGCLGNNLKDRSAGTVVRYNWIEAGNRTLDLVDSGDSDLIQDPAYQETFVYGNVLIKHDVEENNQVLHYGGDSGNTADYRKGTLWFFNNTVVSYRSGNTTLVRLSTNDEYTECFNNVVMATAGSGRLAILNSAGTINLHHNWLTHGWVDAHSTLLGIVNAADNPTGTAPGFVDMADKDYHLATGSRCINAGEELPVDILPDHALQQQYIRHQSYTTRPRDNLIDMGAFESDN